MASPAEAEISEKTAKRKMRGGLILIPPDAIPETTACRLKRGYAADIFAYADRKGRGLVGAKSAFQIAVKKIGIKLYFYGSSMQRGLLREEIHYVKIK